MKLHLGCGDRYIPGWFHIDAQQLPFVDLVSDLQDIPLKSRCAETIYACTVLEHFAKDETLDVLMEWRRLLKPGGTLRLSVPNFAVLARVYLHGYKNFIEPINLELIQGMLVGGQKNEYDFHKNVFDYARLKQYLIEARFTDVRHWNWRKTEHTNIDDYSRAYLPHMDFDRGINTSLNLEATKP